jgi:uncharacterized tellurite resistance protein B-like protein
MNRICVLQPRWCLREVVSELRASLGRGAAAVSTWVRRRVRRTRARASDLHVATGAVLLELLHADAEPTPEQRGHLETALGRELGLDGRAGRALLREAEKVRETKGIVASIRPVAESYSMLQKVKLAHIMHDLVNLDGVVTGRERYVLRKLGNLLRIDDVGVDDLDRFPRERVG